MPVVELGKGGPSEYGNIKSGRVITEIENHSTITPAPGVVPVRRTHKELRLDDNRMMATANSHPLMYGDDVMGSQRLRVECALVKVRFR